MRNDNIRYTYDKKGNITSVRENGREVVRYTYDSLDRLIREDNAVFREKKGNSEIVGKTETFEYDNNGNILAKTRYAYTTSETLSSGTRIEYGYAQSGWRDQLTTYNGESFAYDILGNPTTYRGQPMRWAKGKNLASYIGHTFDYNAAGLRTTKTVGDIETTYYLDGNKILAEERRYKSSGNPIDALYFHYGFDGVTGFEYRKPGEANKTYVYGKNIQGDITHIYTAGGTLVTEYIYDAFGNHSVCADEPCSDIACRNPFRYRAYYYDAAINLYNLQSRYYDSTVGRFINADDVSELDPETINGLNLFTYCANNPIMLSDSEGNAPKWWQWLVSGALIVVGAVLCATGVGTALGVGLLVAGGSMMASNVMSAAGVDGKIATIISSALNIVAGVALMFTPFAAIGASMIGSGVGAIAGGYISEAMGFSFEAGAMIGGIVGGQIYKAASAASLASKASTSTNATVKTGAAAKPATAASKPTAGAAQRGGSLNGTAAQKGAAGERFIKETTGISKNTSKIGNTNRIPDFFSKSKGVLIESKNVARQGLTGQLKDYMAIASKEGVRMELYVRQSTILSSALQKSGIIIKFFPW